jgi:hypothetical protein
MKARHIRNSATMESAASAALFRFKKKQQFYAHFNLKLTLNIKSPIRKTGC